MQSVPDDLKHILGPSEQVQYYIRQKIYHPKINIDSVLITNERVFNRHPHARRLMKNYTEFNFQDMSNVVLEKGLLRSTIKCMLRFGGEPLELSGLPNSDAERAHGLIREDLVRYQSPLAAASTGIPPFHRPGAASAFDAPTCGKCGAVLAAGQRFCGNCGTPL